MSATSPASHQLQVRVTFYTSHNPQSLLMILKKDRALQQITDKARELFPTADYRLFYGDVNGPIYEFNSSEQVISKIRITTFSRTPQLFVRLESASGRSSASKKLSEGRESKTRSSLKRIEQRQELTLKTIEKLQTQLDRVSALETMVADLYPMDETLLLRNVERSIRPTKHFASCDECLRDIIGHRYKCLECADYDLCERCERKSVHYEHAMVRIVHSQKTMIPSYITSNSPNNAFPSYMHQKPTQQATGGIIDIEIKPSVPQQDESMKIEKPLRPDSPSIIQCADPAPAPIPSLIPTTEAESYNEKAHASLLNSAILLKDTFSILSKSFMDLVDGTQTGPNQISLKEKMADLIEMEKRKTGYTRDHHPVYVNTTQPDLNFGPLKNNSDKNIYMETARELVPRSFASAAEKFNKERNLEQEEKKNADKNIYMKSGRGLISLPLASSAEQFKDERNLERESKKNAHKNIYMETARELVPRSFASAAEKFNNERNLEREAKKNARTTTELANKLVELTVKESHQSAESISEDALLKTTNASAPVVNPSAPIASAPIAPVETEQKETRVLSINSSFENIPSDIESLSSSQSGEDMELLQQSLEEIKMEQDVFNRLLEMGFDYDAIDRAVGLRGYDIELCLQYLFSK